MARPRKYASAAEKMQAYRQRKAIEIDELRTRAEAVASPPQIIEKVVERIVTVPAKRSSQKARPSSHPNISPTDRQRVMAERFTGQYGDDEAAKRFRVNAKKAATTTLEIKRLLDALSFEKRQAMAADIDLLEQAARVLNLYSDTFAIAQRDAARAKKNRENKQQQAQETRITATVQELFGSPPELQVVTAMATDLISFTTEIKPWAHQYRDANHALMDIDEHEIKQALHNGNVTLLAKAVAKARLQVPLRGVRHDSTDGRWWHGGWEDFMAWRTHRG